MEKEETVNNSVGPMTREGVRGVYDSRVHFRQVLLFLTAAGDEVDLTASGVAIYDDYGCARPAGLVLPSQRGQD